MKFKQLFKESLPPESNAAYTQRRNTEISYKKVSTMIPKSSLVIDFGAGLGYGKKSFSGFNYISYEPFPRKDFSPDFTSSGSLLSKYESKADVVINNLVLNVVPPNIRASIVLDIGKLLKVNGVAFIATRSDKDVEGAKKKEDGGEESGGYIIGKGKNQTYQKGFTQPELKAYVQSILGNAFTVEKSKHAATGNPQVKVVRIS